MNAIHVRRVQMRCRVSSGREAERERAQRIFRDELTSAIEAAVAAAGISDDEQVCIRTIQLSARLWMGMTDDALRHEWAEALAAEIRRAIAGGDAWAVVRYASEIAAVLDALRSLSRADVTRQWAWWQLGFATTIAPGGRRADTIGELLRSRPQSIAPAFRALADEPSFWRLLASLDDEQLVAIAEAALEAAGIPLRLDAIIAHGAIARVRGGRAASVAQRARAARLLDPHASPRRSVAIAALAALEAEPSLLRGDTNSVCVALAELLEWIRARHGLVPAQHVEKTGREAKQTNESDTAHGVRLQRRESHTPEDAEPAEGVSPHTRSAHDDDPDRNEPALSLEVEHRRSADADQIEAVGSPGADAAPPPDAATAEAHGRDDERAPREERDTAHSDWAGLLFLINVLRDTASIDALLDDVALAARPAAWVLHRLALLLVPADPSDAAVLVFAGLRPGQLPAEFADDPPSEDEQLALLRHARGCVERTCERLGTDASEQVLYAVCARRGEIVADPGWIEVRFPIDTVDLDVRRAGLDLNPDYVSWLGLVLKFAYV